MSRHKAIVEAYFEGFRQLDHPMILDCLTEDVVWDLPGYAHLTGKEAFDRNIEGEEFTGAANLLIDRLLEEGNTVVAIGIGMVIRKSGERFHFAYNDVFTFAGDVICRVESYIVPLNEADGV